MPHSTRTVIRALRRTNPNSNVTEDAVRNTIRRGDIDAPEMFAGRFAWTEDDIAAVARVLGLRVPNPGSGRPTVV